MNYIGSLIKYAAVIIVIISLSKIIIKLIRNGKDSFENSKAEYKPLSNLDAVKFIGSYYLASRFLIFITTYCFHMLSADINGNLVSLLKSIWLRWDSSHYISIAQNWYQISGDEKYFIVFYPLYPLLIKFVHFLVKDYFLSGIFVSNFFLILSLYYLFRLIEIECGDLKYAKSVIRYVLIFPFSFFFSIVYTESLFLALSVMCFYYARRRRFLVSGLCGMLAALTRNQGLLLVIPILVEAIDLDKLLRVLRSNLYMEKAKYFVNILFSVGLVPFGFFLYLLLNKVVTGDWFKFMEYQKEHWYQSFGYFPSNLERHYINIFGMDKNLAIGIWIPQIILFFLVFLLLIYSTNKMRLSYILYSFAYIIISYSPTWLLSGPRYLTGMFTLYIMIAIIQYKHRLVGMLLDIMLAILLCFYSIQFYLWNVY